MFLQSLLLGRDLQPKDSVRLYRQALFEDGMRAHHHGLGYLPSLQYSLFSSYVCFDSTICNFKSKYYLSKLNIWRIKYV